MTQEHLRKRIEFAIHKQFSLMRVELPIKTGRLQYRAFKLEKTEYGWRLYVDLKYRHMRFWTINQNSWLVRNACDRFA